MTAGRSPAETRREFLKGFVKWSFGLLLLLFSATVLRFLYPASIKKRELIFFPLLKEDDLPKRGVKKVDAVYERNHRRMAMRVFVVTSGDRVFALSASCSHLGCLVDWSRYKRQFICPCHGGKYDMEGNVISGPPPLPLQRMPLKMEDGTVSIGIKV